MSDHDLITLAQKQFNSLTPAEEKLFLAVANGEWADYTTEDEEKDKPANANQWNDDRIIAADRIVWLCTDKQAKELVTYKGIQVEGAHIAGKLDLDNVDIGFWIEFVGCTLPQGMSLLQTSVRGLNLQGSHTGPISADRIKVAGSVFLHHGFRAKGEVRLLGADIGGDLSYTNGQFSNPKGQALDADGIKVTGNVFFSNGFRVEGGVRLLSADIGRNFQCDGGQFTNPKGEALNADGIKVTGNVFFSNGFKMEGEVRLLGADIGGDLTCVNGQFTNPKGEALNADGIKVTGNVFFNNGFKAEGEVRLPYADIGGNFECINGQFTNPSNPNNPDGYALNADGIKVAGSVSLSNGFKAEGKVRLLGADIGGNLDCENGQFSNPEDDAICAEGIKVAGNVYLRNGFKAQGRIDLIHANIEKGLVCTNVDSDTYMKLDLRAVKVGTFWDDTASWPDSGRLYLDGFAYERLDDHAPRDAKSRIKWLRRQPAGQFLPQPYEQLAALFKREGLESETKKILIAKEEDPARLAQMNNIFRKAWHCVEKLTICYGYRPWYALLWAMAMVIFGCILFASGMNHGLVVPTSESAYVIQPDNGERKLADTYPRFNSFFYSLDVFLPIIDLHQEKYWLPRAERGSIQWLKWLQYLYLPIPTYGSLLRYYMWFQILAGWLLTSLFIAGLTQVVRS